MMFTRCPACDTAFRITPAQIKARQGRVRCGHCMNSFDALASLAEDAGAPPPADEASIVADDVAAASPETVPPPPEIDDLPPETDALPPEVEDLPPQADDLPHEAEDLLPETDDLPPEVEDLPAEADEQPFDDHPSDHRIEPAMVFADDTEAPAPAPPAPESSESPEPPEPPEQPESFEPPEPSAQFAPPPSAAPVAAPEFRLHEETMSSGRRSWPWLVGGALALAALSIQAAVHFRTTLAARLPETRPLLAALCEPIGCTLEPPRRIDLVEIESSDLTPDQQTPGHLQLVATLRNKAAFAQAWPHLELTLTDVSDRALLRRALAPAEYLPATAQARDGFAAGGDHVVQLRLHAADTPAVGYRLYLFYP